MTTLVSENPEAPWRRRLTLPAYQIGDAARYANVSAKTVADWHKAGARKAVTLSVKESRAALSYLQLIEVAVVAAFRQAGVSLSNIREAREYLAQQFKAENPFARFRFKSDGKKLLMDYDQVEGDRGRGKLLGLNQGGQLAWDAIIGRRLTEFDYDGGPDGIVVRWRVGGPKSSIIIDPQVSFGAPTIEGVPTWAVKGRWEAGESIPDIADDFDLDRIDVRNALKFEGIKPDLKRQRVA